MESLRVDPRSSLKGRTFKTKHGFRHGVEVAQSGKEIVFFDRWIKAIHISHYLEMPFESSTSLHKLSLWYQLKLTMLFSAQPLVSQFWSDFPT